jgi:hypothetical protein
LEVNGDNVATIPHVGRIGAGCTQQDKRSATEYRKKTNKVWPAMPERDIAAPRFLFFCNLHFIAEKSNNRARLSRSYLRVLR